MNHVKINGVDINLDIVSKMKPDKIKALGIFDDPVHYEELIKKANELKPKKKSQP